VPIPITKSKIGRQAKVFSSLKLLHLYLHVFASQGNIGAYTIWKTGKLTVAPRQYRSLHYLEDGEADGSSASERKGKELTADRNTRHDHKISPGPAAEDASAALTCIWVSIKTEQRCADSPLEVGTQVLEETLEGKARVRRTCSPMPQAFGLHAFRCLETPKNVPVSITSENWRSERNSKRSVARKNAKNKKKREKESICERERSTAQETSRGLRSTKRAESKLRLHHRNGITKKQGGPSVGKMLAFFSTCVPRPGLTLPKSNSSRQTQNVIYTLGVFQKLDGIMEN
jgi:hypothetical protein